MVLKNSKLIREAKARWMETAGCHPVSRMKRQCHPATHRDGNRFPPPLPENPRSTKEEMFGTHTTVLA